MNSFQTQTWIEPFSQREIEILRLISEGLSNLEISQKLLLSPETIKWYNKQIFVKLGARSRTQAVRMASDFGLLDSQRTATLEVEESRRSGNLPAQLTSFVGRGKEIAEIKYLLKSSRLVVLTGPGGCGKSRLALQVAADLVDSYRDGVWLVELASISDPALVVNAVIQTLMINASSDTSLVDVLKRFLVRKHLLLLFDNFEHLPEASRLVGELLAVAPQVTVLATSRERLHIYGEQEYPVHPLSLPDLHKWESKEQLLNNEAVNLFVQRSRAVLPGFTPDKDQINHVARMCVRLDGLPLAIELAASQVKIYPPAILAQRLEEGLDALPSGPRDLPARQRTLRATLEWSYNLLQDNEKILLARLSVFSGGGTLDSIRVCSRGLSGNIIDILNALVEKNLVYPRQGSDGELRFTMLETIHEYASERLSAFGQSDSIRVLHADYFANLVESADAEIYTARQAYWFARLREEQDNLRSVLTWSLNGNEFVYGLRLAAVLHTYWAYDGLGAEGRRWTDLALARSTQATPSIRAGVLRSAGRIAYPLSDLRRGKKLLGQALELYQELGDERNAAWTMAYLGGDYQENPHECAQGMDLCKQGLAIFTKLEDKPGMAYTFNILGELARLQDDYEAARHYYEESLSIVKETGERQREAILFNNLCFITYRQHEYRLAMHYTQRSLIVARDLKSEFRQACFLATIAGPTAVLGQPELAARLLGAAHARFEALGTRHQPADQRELDLFEANTRSQLSEEAFQEAWQAGQAMTLQEAVSLALNDLDLVE